MPHVVAAVRAGAQLRDGSESWVDRRPVSGEMLAHCFPPITGFLIFDRLVTFTLHHEAESGSLMPRLGGLLVNSFQFTRPTRLDLVFQTFYLSVLRGVSPVFRECLCGMLDSHLPPILQRFRHGHFIREFQVASHRNPHGDAESPSSPGASAASTGKPQWPHLPPSDSWPG